MSKRILPVIFGYGGLMMGVAFSGCAKLEQVTQALQGEPAGGSSASRFSLCVHEADGGGNALQPALFCDRSSSSALQLAEGQNYVFQISEESAEAYTYRMTLRRIDVINSVESTPVVLNAGANLVAAPQMGDYSIQIAPQKGEQVFAARNFQSSVTCSNPSALNAAGLNAGAITATVAARNIYNFSAAGVVGAAAGGVGPYQCAFDFNGDGTRDSVFADCGTAVANRYVNQVGMRSVGLIVRDSCNSSVSIRGNVLLDPSSLLGLTPGSGDVFIHGQISNATGVGAGHLGIDGVNYYATNNGGLGIAAVQPNFSYNGASSSFTIASNYTYGMPSSASFGMRLVVRDLNASLTDSVATSTISAANARMASVEYTTDQAGDAQARISMSGTNCTLTNQGAVIREVQGVPCSPGSTNPEWADRRMTWVVHVWGNYSCPVSGGGAGALITGEFDGLAFLVDACIGGGGGGGGGIVPIEL